MNFMSTNHLTVSMPAKLRILFVVPQIYPHVMGGYQIATYKLINKLRDKGIHTICITSYRRKKEGEGCLKASIKYVPAFLPREVLNALVFFMILPAYLFILRNKYDIIHVHPIWYPFAIVAFLKSILKKPLVIWGRGADIYAYHSYNLLKKSLIKLLVQKADVVLALTYDMKRKIENISGRKDIIIIPNGIEPILTEERVSKSMLKRRLDIRENTDSVRLLLYSGRLVSFKGVQYLIKAMKKVINKYENTYLIIVGDGAFKGELVKLAKRLGISNNVVFLGAIPHKTLLHWLPNFDVFVYPEVRGQGISNAVLEAMASGVPVIASNVGGLPEVIIHQQTGLLVPPGSPEHIASSIIELLTNNDLREKIISKAKETISAKFNLDVTVEKLLAVYQSVLGG